MNKIDILNSITRGFHKCGFQLKKHSPEILIGAGIVGVVTSAVMACKATTKLSGILDETKETVEKIHEVAEDPEMADKYTEEDSKKDLTIVYTQTGVQVAKLYAPAVAIGVTSIVCILASANIMHKRNVALAAAYATIDRSFKDYRSRVVERFGKDLDRELRYNIKAEEVEEKVIDDETGEETVVKKTVNAVDPNTYSDYACFFDEYCEGWTKDPELNLMFLRKQQAFATDKLKARGYLFLNEVYEMIGKSPTKAGQAVGWIYDEKNPIGDNFVDFGIYDIDNERSRDFVNGRERSILLDFNVDGVIWDKL